MGRWRNIFSLATIALVAACSGSNFSGQQTNAQPPPEPKPAVEEPDQRLDANANGDDRNDDRRFEEPDPGETKEPRDTYLDQDDIYDAARNNEQIMVEYDEVSVRPDYEGCTELVNRGKRGYGRCEKNEVVVIINDGKAQEMTCCPLGDKRMLSKDRDDHHVPRTGMCRDDEVTTGMQSPHGPEIFCSKINTEIFRLSSPVGSQYTSGGGGGSDAMSRIAGSYNNNDTCICREGYIMHGGHTAADNRCSDQCVKIIFKDDPTESGD